MAPKLIVRGIEPPKEVYLVDRHRLFGLTTDPLVLLHVRQKRAREMGARGGAYVDIVGIEDEIEASRALMRSLGAIMVRTDNRAIEESASEILRHLEPPVEEGVLQDEDAPLGGV